MNGPRTDVKESCRHSAVEWPSARVDIKPKKKGGARNGSGSGVPEEEWLWIAFQERGCISGRMGRCRHTKHVG